MLKTFIFTGTVAGLTIGCSQLTSIILNRHILDLRFSDTFILTSEMVLALISYSMLVDYNILPDIMTDFLKAHILEEDELDDSSESGSS